MLSADHFQESVNRKKLQTLATNFGSCLEYYDFVVYVLLARYFSGIFFPTAELSLIPSFVVFSLGYFIRPFGGILFGMLGDLLGRKVAFLRLTALMVFSTLGIGLLPSYQQVGIIAPILLVTCRLLQGLSFGGEMPGAVTLISEIHLPKEHGNKLSVTLASTTLGALAASATLYLLTQTLSDSQMNTFGWRIPFLIGGFLGFILLFMRNNIQETSSFFALAKNRTPKFKELVKELLTANKAKILAGIGLTSFLSAMIILNLYFPFYIGQQFKMISPAHVYLAGTLGLIFCILILPFTGKLADKFQQPKLMTISLISYCLLVKYIFSLLGYTHFLFILLFMCLHQFFIALVSSCYFPILAKIFRTQVRFTGIALCYNITYAAMSLLPGVLTSLSQSYSRHHLIPLFLASIALLSCSSLFYLEQAGLLTQNDVS